LWKHEIGPAVVTDGESVSVGPDLVSAYAWWEGDATKAELEAQVRDEAQLDRDGLWIWVYHSPPDDSPTSWSGRRHFGDDLLNSLIERYRPDLVLTGHVHEAPYEPAGSWHDRIGTTTVLNAGRQTASVPAHVVIDSDARTATWSTMASRDAIEF
jgi:Icc-related predicted phosphoesterase